MACIFAQGSPTLFIETITPSCADILYILLPILDSVVPSIAKAFELLETENTNDWLKSKVIAVLDVPIVVGLDQTLIVKVSSASQLPPPEVFINPLRFFI